MLRKKVLPPPPPTSLSLNERFTDLADNISSFLGDWKFTVISLGILALWTIYGAVVIAQQVSGWFTSQQWNFPLNTITTVGEWFIGALVAAAANRVERHNHQQTERLDKMEQQNLRMEREHGIMLAEVRQEVKDQREIVTDLREIIKDLHTHTTCIGHTTIGTPPARKSRTKAKEEPAA